MPLGRLLVAALVLCPVPALAQGHSVITTSRNVQAAPDFRPAPVANSSEPWRIIPKPENDKGLVLAPELGSEGMVALPDGPLGGGITCLSIRSYVVKRDSKDSDAVHPAGYSTCVPVARFRLKTADLHSSLAR